MVNVWMVVIIFLFFLFFLPFFFLKRVATDRTEPHRFASATRNVNKTKNRFVNIMPCKIMMGVAIGVSNQLFPIDEYNRVKLSFIRATEGSDFINASYIDVSYLLMYSIYVYGRNNFTLLYSVVRVIDSNVPS